MRAIFHAAYGPPDLLELKEIERPSVGDGDVLVRVHAAGLHVGDSFGVRGTPFGMRLATGLFRPRSGVPGFDLAGHVEAVGKAVTRFRPGDEVFGACAANASGACAEYARLDENQLALKPANLTLHDAAALPTSGLAALRGIRDACKVKAGQRVLINGAAGGVGSFAVQIAKALGAEVTGVCSTANIDFVRSLGADDVVDYTREDFTGRAGRYDCILDNVENRALSDMRRALAPEGILVLNSGTGADGMKMMVRLVKPLLLNVFTRQTLRRFLSAPNHDDLVVLKQLVEAGKVRPAIDRVFTLAETPEALRHIESGHARGKVVVTV